jgi:hypothetical protein
MKDIVIDIKETTVRNIEKIIRAKRLSDMSKMINVWKKQNDGYQFVYDDKFSLPIHLSNDMHTITMNFQSIDTLGRDVSYTLEGLKEHAVITERKITEYPIDNSSISYVQIFNSFIYKDIEDYYKYIFIKLNFKVKINYDTICSSYEFRPITNSEVMYFSIVDHPNTTYIMKASHCIYRDGILKL